MADQKKYIVRLYLTEIDITPRSSLDKAERKTNLLDLTAERGTAKQVQQLIQNLMHSTFPEETDQ